jgi:4-hydroxyphenylpyruvate dioxygenase
MTGTTVAAIVLLTAAAQLFNSSSSAFQLSSSPSATRKNLSRHHSSSQLYQTPTQEQRQEEGTTESWKPTISSLSERKQYFREQSAQSSEHLGTLGFHHVEFYAGDALMTAKRFELALGIPITCWSSLATGNDKCVTYGLECGVDDNNNNVEPGDGVRFLITAPLSRAMQQQTSNSSSSSGGAGSNVQMTAPNPLPGYDINHAHEFYAKHGLAVRAVGIEVEDANKAYAAAVDNGAVGSMEPSVIPSYYDKDSEKECRVAEVELYGDVVLRFVSFHRSTEKKGDDSETSLNQKIPFLPHLAPYPSYKSSKPTYGLSKIDHTVGNVPNLLKTQAYIQKFTGYHPFAEFTPEDIGTVDSGLNSVVLASDSEAVLLPLNEPTEGKRKSQIQTYLEQNEGSGLQHIAIKTNDIFDTISKMRYAEENLGGFELMVRPSDGYYRELPSRLGDKLTEDQYKRLEELGILADADEEGVLLQIFTKPLGDRPTLFIEIIQRIGCIIEDEDLVADIDSANGRIRERPGCGGFGQGNFRELFKAIEDHEKTLKV